MRATLIALLLVPAGTIVSLAQENHYLDSLWQVYRQPGPVDYARLALYHEIVDETRYVDVDSARTLAETFLRSAKAFGNAELVGLAYRDLGNVAAESRDNDAAVRYYKLAIGTYATLKDTIAIRGMATSLNNLGIVYKNMGLLDSALAMDRRAVSMNQRIGNRNGSMFAYASIARVHEIQGANDSALFYYALSGELAEELGDRHTLAGSYGNRANVYERMGRIGPAIDLAYKCLATFEELHSERSIAIALTTVASLKGELGEVDEALQLLRRSYALYGKVGYRQGMMTSGNSIGSNLLELGRTDSAVVWLERTVELEREFDARDIMDRTLNSLGRAYLGSGRAQHAVPVLEEALELARSIKDMPAASEALALLGRAALDLGEPRKARDRCTQGYSTALSAAALDERGQNCECLYLANKALGDGMAAVRFLEEYHTVRDSVLSERNARELTRRDMRYAFGKQQLEDSLRHANELVELDHARALERLRADRNRNTALGFGGAGVILIAGVSAFFISDRRRRRARFEQEAAQLETQALRSQMNPHFIFNALNSINAFVQRNDADRASTYLSKFARLMRLVLENSRQAEVPLKDDLEALDLYLQLERSRSGDRFDYSISVDPTIDQENVLVPPLVIQPFVENAIWHGMAGKEDKGHISLSVSRNGDTLTMAIEDDGVGRQADRGGTSTTDPMKKTSLATTITRSRLDLVRRQKGRPAGFTILDLHQGTRVEVNLPISDGT